ncbi:MAG TPA: helix-turn-helix transcriptional regulator [Rhabdochlamydiaceae bacterium]|nr:helix-turn-helix transcriptional regulator [Rhabdochlamydiaceae bacterium]
MKRFISSEKLLIEELAHAAKKAKEVSRGLSLNSLIKMIRIQLGMSQKVLSKRSGIPQAAISRIEKGKKNVAIDTLNKILKALYCDLVMVPLLLEPIDSIRKKQAKKKAEKHIHYLKGTMNLEVQQPDSRLVEELLKQEEDRLLKKPGSELWEE